MLALVALTAPALAQDASERAAADRCLTHWGEHPFGDAETFKVLAPTVRVMGFGSAEVVEKPTSEPELVLIEPTVSVLTKTTWKLNNPNGWYCFNASVGVLAKVRIEAACEANLADSRSGATVLGRSDLNGGVEVLGETEVHRQCNGAGKRAEPVTEELSTAPLSVGGRGVGPYTLGEAEVPITHRGVKAESMEGTMCALWVSDARHRTFQGLGIGSTLDDFSDVFGAGRMEAHGDTTVWFDKAGIAVVVDERAFSEAASSGAALPKSTKVTGLRIGGCPE